MASTSASSLVADVLSGTEKARSMCLLPRLLTKIRVKAASAPGFSVVRTVSKSCSSWAASEKGCVLADWKDNNSINVGGAISI